MNRIFMILAICLFAFSTFCQEVESIDRLYAQGLYEKVYDQAEACFDQDSTSWDCLGWMAKAANAQGDQSKAKLWYHQLEAQDSVSAEVYMSLGKIYEQQGQLARAIKYYTKVNDLLPENAAYFRKNARLYQQYGDHTQAFFLYARANQLNPRDIVTIKNMGEIVLENDQPHIADSLIRIGLLQDSLHVGLNYLRAKSKYKQKEFDTVALVLDKMEGQVDHNSYHNKMFGYAYLQIDSLDLAVSRFQSALVQDPDSEKLHYYLATAFEKLDNMEGALNHYEKAVKYGVSPDLDLYHRSVGRLANGVKDYKKAVRAYQDAYKYGGDPVVLYYLAAVSDLYYKDKDIAVRYYERYLKSGHQHHEYRSYAEKRSRYLKEVQHQSKRK